MVTQYSPCSWTFTIVTLIWAGVPSSSVMGHERAVSCPGPRTSMHLASASRLDAPAPAGCILAATSSRNAPQAERTVGGGKGVIRQPVSAQAVALSVPRAAVCTSAVSPASVSASFQYPSPGSVGQASSDEGKVSDRLAAVNCSTGPWSPQPTKRAASASKDAPTNARRRNYVSLSKLTGSARTRRTIGSKNSRVSDS